MEFFTQFSRPSIDDSNPGGGEILTESAGYVPIDKQIIDLINAGVRLGEYREERFDFADGEQIDVDNVIPDPTRDGDFEEGDAVRLMNSVGVSLDDSKRILKVIDELKAKKTNEGVDPPKKE